MLELQGKKVWLTGASSGIGAALAKEFNRCGASLVLTARDEENLKRVQDSCFNTSAAVHLAPVDLSEIDQLPRKAKDIVDRFGPFDLFIGNAGISQRSLFFETNTEVIRTLIATNLTAHLILVRSVLPLMLERRAGTIALVSSIAGKFGAPFRSVYCATKAALHGFAESLAIEVWEKNVNVSMIVPGFVRTNISYNSLKGDGSRYRIMDGNQERGIEPEGCARRIIVGLQKGKREIYVGLDGKARLALLVSRFFPKVFARIIRRIKV